MKDLPRTKKGIAAAASRVTEGDAEMTDYAPMRYGDVSSREREAFAPGGPKAGIPV